MAGPAPPKAHLRLPPVAGTALTPACSDGNDFTTLRRFSTPYNTRATCEERLEDDPSTTARTICTGPPSKMTGQGVCDGDSGGQLSGQLLPGRMRLATPAPLAALLCRQARWLQP